jgi:DNA mismatch repair protein MutS
MTFQSILVEQPAESIKNEPTEEPPFFKDLNLDQIVSAVTVGNEEYNLKPFFYRPPDDIVTIKYRHEIIRDLQNSALPEYLALFSSKMRTMREHLIQASKRHYEYQKQVWFLGAVEVYCDAVNCLAHGLGSVDVASRGFLAFREYLIAYSTSDYFRSILAETNRLKAHLSEVRYCLRIRDNSVTVQRYASEIDLSAEVEKTFIKFKEGATKDYRAKFSNSPDMNHVEAKILDFVAKLYPQIFSVLSAYCDKNSNFADDTISRFDREIQFYVAYLEHAEILKRARLSFCYPQISTVCKELYNRQGFDLALA